MAKYRLAKPASSVEEYSNIRKNTLGEEARIVAEVAINNSWFGVHVI